MLVLQHGQCAQQHTNRVPSANGVFRPSEVFGEQYVCLRCGGRRERE